MAIHLEPLTGCPPRLCRGIQLSSAAADYASCFWRAGMERIKAFGADFERLMAEPQRRMKI